MHNLLTYAENGGDFAFSLARKDQHQSLLLAVGKAVTNVPKQFSAECGVEASFRGSIGILVIGRHLQREALEDIAIDDDFSKLIFAVAHAGLRLF